MAADNALSISPVKAKYGAKKDYLTVVKQGFLLLEFVPLAIYPNTASNEPGTPKRVFNWQEKQSFVLDPLRAVELLPINMSAKQPFNFAFNYNKEGVNKSLSMTSAWEKNEVKINFEVHAPAVNMSIKNQMTIPQFLVLQKMIDYTLPYMMGWHVLSSNRIAQEDFLNDSN